MKLKMKTIKNFCLKCLEEKEGDNDYCNDCMRYVEKEKIIGRQHRIHYSTGYHTILCGVKKWECSDVNWENVECKLCLRKNKTEKILWKHKKQIKVLEQKTNKSSWLKLISKKDFEIVKEKYTIEDEKVQSIVDSAINTDVLALRVTIDSGLKILTKNFFPKAKSRKSLIRNM